MPYSFFVIKMKFSSLKSCLAIKSVLLRQWNIVYCPWMIKPVQTCFNISCLLNICTQIFGKIHIEQPEEFIFSILKRCSLSLKEIVVIYITYDCLWRILVTTCSVFHPKKKKKKFYTSLLQNRVILSKSQCNNFI